MFKSELTDYLCLLTKSMRLKQKCLFQSVLKIAYFDSLICTFVKKLFLDTVWKGLHFNCLSYLILYIPNNIQILVIISTYDVQLSSLESDITPKSAKSKNDPNYHFHYIVLISIWIWINIITFFSKKEIAFFLILIGGFLFL